MDAEITNIVNALLDATTVLRDAIAVRRPTDDQEEPGFILREGPPFPPSQQPAGAAHGKSLKARVRESMASGITGESNIADHVGCNLMQARREMNREIHRLQVVRGERVIQRRGSAYLDKALELLADAGSRGMEREDLFEEAGWPEDKRHSHHTTISRYARERLRIEASPGRRHWYRIVRQDETA